MVVASPPLTITARSGDSAPQNVPTEAPATQPVPRWPSSVWRSAPTQASAKQPAQPAATSRALAIDAGAMSGQADRRGPTSGARRDHPNSSGDNLIFIDAIALYPDDSAPAVELPPTPAPTDTISLNR